MVGDKGEAAVPAVPGRLHGALLLHIGAPPAGPRVGLPGPQGAFEGRVRNFPSGNSRLHNGFVQFSEM